MGGLMDPTRKFDIYPVQKKKLLALIGKYSS